MRNAIDTGMIFGVEILVSHNLKCEIKSSLSKSQCLFDTSTFCWFKNRLYTCQIHKCDNGKINNLLFITLKIQQRVNCDENETVLATH